MNQVLYQFGLKCYEKLVLLNFKIMPKINKHLYTYTDRKTDTQKHAQQNIFLSEMFLEELHCRRQAFDCFCCSSYFCTRVPVIEGKLISRNNSPN